MIQIQGVLLYLKIFIKYDTGCPISPIKYDDQV